MKRKAIRVLILLLLLLGMPLGIWRLYLSHVISKQLVVIRKGGEPINGEELNRWYPAVPDNQNAALVLMQAFALRRTYPDTRSNLLLNFKLPKRAEPLSPERAELLRDYTALNEACVRKAYEALQLPASRYPVDFSQLMSTPLPHLAWLKGIAEFHQYAAFLGIVSHNPSVASNIVTILALARTLDNEPCHISQLVRLQLFKMAFATLERRANAGMLNSSETTILAAAFAQTRFTNIAVAALIGERAMTIPYFRMTKAEAKRLSPDRDSKTGPPLPCDSPAILRLIGYYDLDYGSYLIGMNKAIALLDNSPPENLRAGGYLYRVGEASMKRRRTLSGMLLSAYAGVARRENEGIAMQLLALTAIAVEQFANDTGRVPNKLEELTPKFLTELPEDPFTGLELKYRRTERGYVAYSVGPDRQDNGGLENPHENIYDDKKSSDITFTVER